jgi:hypothetical protein
MVIPVEPRKPECTAPGAGVPLHCNTSIAMRGCQQARLKSDRVLIVERRPPGKRRSRPSLWGVLNEIDAQDPGGSSGRRRVCLWLVSKRPSKTNARLRVQGTFRRLSGALHAAKKQAVVIRYYVIRTPIFIPWNCLQIADAKFPMRRHLRFSVPSTNAFFFVPLGTGRLLLTSVGR